jgi:lipopolysaccharide/colanic/teichoic acid biosynthesis glycosyltransferase
MPISRSAVSGGLDWSARSDASTRSGIAAADVAPEAVFMQTLRKEVRRSERSGRPFALALISGDPFVVGDNGAGIVSDIAAAITSSTRETDWLGWYEQDAALGVLLTEIGDVDDAKVQLIAQKVASALQNAVSEEDFNRLKLEVRLFAPQSDDPDDDGWRESFYRELWGPQKPGYAEGLLKRSIDIVGSLIAMLLFLPVFLVIALLVKLSSRGPVLFCQKRIGAYGRLFDFYKFRSMYADNDPSVHRDYVSKLIEGSKHAPQPNGMYKLVNDPRVTPLGRLLRKYSLDELPQFMNVLLGDMSLVGPRPPLPYEVDRYRCWHRRRVMDVKPGLTGLWQIEGRSRTTFDEMVRMDLRYARTQSLWLDLKIILHTPAAMLSGNGAS